MEIDIVREYERFIDNYDFNRDLSLRRTEKPHLARWAYGACEEWIKDFENSFKIWLENEFKGFTEEIKKEELYSNAIKEKKEDLPNIRQTLRNKFSDNKILMRELS